MLIRLELIYSVLPRHWLLQHNTGSQTYIWLVSAIPIHCPELAFQADHCQPFNPLYYWQVGPRLQRCKTKKSFFKMFCKCFNFCFTCMLITSKTFV